MAAQHNHATGKGIKFLKKWALDKQCPCESVKDSAMKKALNLSHRSTDSRNHPGWVVFKRAFPNANHCPASIAKCFCDLAIASTIFGDLCSPKITVGYRKSKARGMPMPEISIDKHSDLRTSKDKIWATHNVGSTSPTCDTRRPHQGKKPQLRRLISLAFNRRHDGGTLFDAYRIGHNWKGSERARVFQLKNLFARAGKRNSLEKRYHLCDMTSWLVANLGLLLPRLIPSSNAGFTLHSIFQEPILKNGSFDLRKSLSKKRVNQVCLRTPKNEWEIQMKTRNTKSKNDEDGLFEGTTFIDLFCGAGGLTEGLRQAGLIPKVGVDFDPHAIATYAANHPTAATICRDISTVTGPELLEKAGVKEIDLIVGGPSCQGFSTHGKRIEDDPRNFLFKHFVRLVDETRPKYFLMENVKGLLGYSKGYFKKLIEEAFERIGYRVQAQTHCAAEYGVPQLRHRVLFIGTRIPNGELSFPEPTHGEMMLGKLPFVSVKEAINDLPLIEEQWDRSEWSYRPGAKTEFQRYARAEAKKIVTLHKSNPLSGQAAKLASFIGQGQGLRAVPPDYLPERFKKMRKISNGQLRRDCTTLYYRLHEDRPAYTITCYYRNVASGPFLHPHENRALSHREAARLMSYPDHYQFKGSNICRQIGNSVPPLLGKAMGTHLLRLLREAVLERVLPKAA